jgi:ribonuclease BN (tRNA processing enzyme)
VRLTVLGCSGSFPGPDSPASAYLLEHDGFRLVLDMGNGAVGSLQRHVGLFDIDAIFVSHLHADHCLDMCSYVVARRYHPERPGTAVPVLAPRGAHERLSQAFDFNGGSLADVFDFSEASAARASAPRGGSGRAASAAGGAAIHEIGPFQVRTERVNHPVETYAIRLEADGRSLAYSGDTGESPGLVALAKDADVLLCEASFTEDRVNPSGLHLTGREAGRHATEAGVGRLLVTHIPVWTDPVRVMAEVDESFTGPAEAVSLDAVYEI